MNDEFVMLCMTKYIYLEFYFINGVINTLVGFGGTIYSFPDKFHLYLQSYFSTFICKVTFPDKAVFM